MPIFVRVDEYDFHPENLPLPCCSSFTCSHIHEHNLEKQLANAYCRSGFDELVDRTGSAVGFLGINDVMFFRSQGFDYEWIGSCEIDPVRHECLSSRLSSLGVYVSKEDFYDEILNYPSKSISCIYFDLEGLNTWYKFVKRHWYSFDQLTPNCFVQITYPISNSRGSYRQFVESVDRDLKNGTLEIELPSKTREKMNRFLRLGQFELKSTPWQDDLPLRPHQLIRELDRGGFEADHRKTKIARYRGVTPYHSLKRCKQDPCLDVNHWSIRRPMMETTSFVYPLKDDLLYKAYLLTVAERRGLARAHHVDKKRVTVKHRNKTAG